MSQCLLHSCMKLHWLVLRPPTHDEKAERGKKVFLTFSFPPRVAQKGGEGERQGKTKAALGKDAFFLFIFREDDEGGDEILSRDNARDIVEC